VADAGSFVAQSEALRAAATLWADAATDMRAAITEISPGVGGGSSFGVLAGASGVAGHYDDWSGEMLAACRRARDNFDYLEAALDSAANHFDGVDATVATDFSRLDGMIS